LLVVNGHDDLDEWCVHPLRWRLEDLKLRRHLVRRLAAEGEKLVRRREDLL
jgi:hypothetical protein